jgi:XTP/dITP diphosphohydrolase
VKLLLASHNHGKAVEISRLLEDTGWRVVSLTSVDSKFDVVEDGLTFRDNARKKARAVAERFKMWTLADDSGLVIDALDGEPGVHSARYCGPGATDADRVRSFSTGRSRAGLPIIRAGPRVSVTTRCSFPTGTAGRSPSSGCTQRTP